MSEIKVKSGPGEVRCNAYREFPSAQPPRNDAISCPSIKEKRPTLDLIVAQSYPRCAGTRSPEDGSAGETDQAVLQAIVDNWAPGVRESCHPSDSP